MKDQLIQELSRVCGMLGIIHENLTLDYPENVENGDFSSNIAMANAKKMATNPRELADKIVAELLKNKSDVIKDVKVAGPGFINFFVNDEIFSQRTIQISEGINPPVKNNVYNILVEHTDPNTFKPIHIGHLMANSIGESLVRLIQYSGDKVTRICYPSDIGLHIAKSIWAIHKNKRDIPPELANVIERTAFLGKMYAEGTASYVSDPKAKAEIDELNKVIYEKTNAAVTEWYEKGKSWSMEHFDLLCKRLGSQFDQFIFESEMAPLGMEIVKSHMGKVFAESEGAIVFKGEEHGLHTRVFVNSVGLPTYETKELGLNTFKFKTYPNTDLSIIVTASEQNEYFKVITKALSLIDENIGSKTKHIGHGMLRFASGKMSSRTGNVITAEALISEIKEMVLEKMRSNSEDKFEPAELDEITDMIAIAAIKYTILRQAIGTDVIFDSAKSISFEGDSGPYLQYSAVRASAVLEKAKNEGITALGKDGAVGNVPNQVGMLEKLISRFPDISRRARNEYAPQIIANYLISLAGEFNSFYAKQVIVDKNDKLSPYYVALTKAFYETISNGLWILGIKVPRKM